MAQANGIELGLMPAPGVAAQLAEALTTELPELLARHVDDGIAWSVPVVTDPLTGAGDAREILDVCQTRRQHADWDLAVCLSDLPIYRSGQLVMADVSYARRVIAISVPALGMFRLRRRLRQVVLELVAELYWQGYMQNSAVDVMEPEAQRRRTQRSGQLIGGQLARLVATQRVDPPSEDMRVLDVEAVLLMYALVVVLVLLLAVIILPKAMLEAALQEPIQASFYPTVAWVASSLAMLAGASGVSLVDEEKVRRTAFGYRQRRRLEEQQQRLQSDGDSTSR